MFQLAASEYKMYHYMFTNLQTTIRLRKTTKLETADGVLQYKRKVIIVFLILFLLLLLLLQVSRVFSVLKVVIRHTCLSDVCLTIMDLLITLFAITKMLVNVYLRFRFLCLSLRPCTVHARHYGYFVLQTRPAN